MAKIVFSPEAGQDLADTGDYIAFKLPASFSSYSSFHPVLLTLIHSVRLLAPSEQTNVPYEHYVNQFTKREATTREKAVAFILTLISSTNWDLPFRFLSVAAGLLFANDNCCNHKRNHTDDANKSRT